MSVIIRSLVVGSVGLIVAVASGGCAAQSEDEVADSAGSEEALSVPECNVRATVATINFVRACHSMHDYDAIEATRTRNACMAYAKAGVDAARERLDSARATYFDKYGTDAVSRLSAACVSQYGGVTCATDPAIEDLKKKYGISQLPNECKTAAEIKAECDHWAAQQANDDLWHELFTSEGQAYIGAWTGYEGAKGKYIGDLQQCEAGYRQGTSALTQCLAGAPTQRNQTFADCRKECPSDASLGGGCRINGVLCGKWQKAEDGFFGIGKSYCEAQCRPVDTGWGNDLCKDYTRQLDGLNAYAKSNSLNVLCPNGRPATPKIDVDERGAPTHVEDWNREVSCD